MSVLAYHPQTGALEVLSDEQLVHMRIAGWMLKSEWDEMEAAKAAAEAAASKTAPSGKDK